MLIRFLMAVFAVVLAIMPTQNAAAKDNLTIYTYESFVSEWGPGPLVKKRFEESCDCQINWVGIADGVALLNRLKLEGENSKADVVLGLDTNLIAEATASGLFAPSNVNTDDLKLPVKWDDKTFVPYDYAHFAVVYDSEKVTNPPTSLKELVNGDKAVKIVLQDPRTSTPGLGFLLWIKAVYGDDAPAAWKTLQDRILTVTPGWSEAYNLFTKGEAPMVLSYTTSPAYHMIEEKSQRYKAAKFSEGHYLQIEVAGRLKAAKNPQLAEKFLQFMIGPGGQDFIATKNWMMPVGKTSKSLPKEFDELVKPEKSFLLSSEKVAKNRKAWIGEWLNAMSK